MSEIVPAIIAKSFEDLEIMARRVAPYVKKVHVDVMDGIFVPNDSIGGPDEVSRMTEDLLYDIHLMVQNPIDQLPNWDKVIKIDIIFVHVESDGSLRDKIDKISYLGRRVGVALNPETPLSEIHDYIDQIDCVQFMTVDPGRYGSPFIPDVLKKVTVFHARYPEKLICIDGGVRTDNIKLVAEAGATYIVSGSFIYTSPDPEMAIKQLKSAI